MGKKKRHRSTKHGAYSGRSEARPPKSAKFVYIVLAVGIGLILSGAFFYFQKKEPQRPNPVRAQVKRENYRFRETKKTLQPALFQGRIYVAYQIARDIPEVLDQLYCYCRCRENNGHINLLSCYTSTHAST